jgi:hypothetical protein
MRVIAGLFGALFFLVALFLMVAVMLGGMGTTAQIQQIYLLASISSGVLAVFFAAAAGDGGETRRLREAVEKQNRILEAWDRQGRKPPPTQF